MTTIITHNADGSTITTHTGVEAQLTHEEIAANWANAVRATPSTQKGKRVPSWERYWANIGDDPDIIVGE